MASRATGNRCTSSKTTQLRPGTSETRWSVCNRSSVPWTSRSSVNAFLLSRTSWFCPEKSMKRQDSYSRAANSRTRWVLPTRRAPSTSSAYRPARVRFHSSICAYAFRLKSSGMESSVSVLATRGFSHEGRLFVKQNVTATPNFQPAICHRHAKIQYQVLSPPRQISPRRQRQFPPRKFYNPMTIRKSESARILRHQTHPRTGPPLQ